jgi:hypothetical protein
MPKTVRQNVTFGLNLFLTVNNVTKSKGERVVNMICRMCKKETKSKTGLCTKCQEANRKIMKTLKKQMFG